MQKNLTQGNPTKVMLYFAIPMIIGNLLQQLYNVADTFIVGHYLGAKALAAVGSSFTLMTFLTSVIIGLCMGSGAIFSMLYGAQKNEELKNSLYLSFLFIGAVSLIINVLVLSLLEPILQWMQFPNDVICLARDYLKIISYGILFTFVYNFVTVFLRSLGNSLIPLVFLAVSAVLNILLDIFFILDWNMGVAGAALATTISQGVSALGITLYGFWKTDLLRIRKKDMAFNLQRFGTIAKYSLLTSIQQSIMNFGILMVQGLVNRFGSAVMAAFAAAVKIDSFAYSPAQDFGNAFSIFLSQNYGGHKPERIRKGIRSGIWISLVFCFVVSATVISFAPDLMKIFIAPEESEIIAIGVQYLQIEGACYWGIGLLFLLYGLFRGVGRPEISVVLTVISLGIRVALSYALAPIPAYGVTAIWWSIPIGWITADLAGLIYYRIKIRPALLSEVDISPLMK